MGLGVVQYLYIHIYIYIQIFHGCIGCLWKLSRLTAHAVVSEKKMGEQETQRSWQDRNRPTRLECNVVILVSCICLVSQKGSRKILNLQVILRYHQLQYQKSLKLFSWAFMTSWFLPPKKTYIIHPSIYIPSQWNCGTHPVNLWCQWNQPQMDGLVPWWSLTLQPRNGLGIINWQ